MITVLVARENLLCPTELSGETRLWLVIPQLFFVVINEPNVSITVLALESSNGRGLCDSLDQALGVFKLAVGVGSVRDLDDLEFLLSPNPHSHMSLVRELQVVMVDNRTKKSYRFCHQPQFLFRE